MPYFFFILSCLFLFLCCFNISEIWNLEQDNVSLKLTKISESEVKNIFKRSIVDNILITKTFLERNRLYQCQINVIFLDFSHLNQIFILRDYINTFTVDSVQSNANILIINDNFIHLQFNYTRISNFSLSYNFIPNNLSGTVVRNATVFSQSMNAFVTDNGCLIRANFNDTVRTNSALICCCFLALLIVLIVFIIIWFLVCFPRRKNIYTITNVKTNEAFYIQKYSLLLEESQKSTYNARYTSNQKSFATTFKSSQPRDTEYNIFEIDVANARDADIKLNDDFKRVNDVFFNIWVNSISQYCPYTKERLNHRAQQIIAERENIRKRYENLIIEKAKEITKQVVEVNKDNLSNLKMAQDAERTRIMQLVQPEEQAEVEENLNKVFENETRNMVIQLKVKQDEAFEEAKMKCHTDMMNEINMTQMSLVKTLSSENQINQDDIEDIIKRYIQWQEKLQCLSESEKIRQAAALAYLLESKRNQAQETENQNKEINELLEKKVDHFETTICEFEENDEISREMSSKILTQFELDRQKIIMEMDKSKEDQVKSLLERLNENKRKAFENLKLKQENELNNVIMTHCSDTNVQDLIDELNRLEVNHRKEITAAEQETDEESNEALRVLLNECGTQTTTKIDEKIEEISSELKREGFSEEDIKEILDDSNKKIKRIQKIQQQERVKQKKLLEERLEKIKNEIEANSLKQSKDQSYILGVQNDVLNEIMSMQKTLSDEERNKIMEQYSKNKFSLETNLASSRLLQKRKIEELINSKKMKENVQLSAKFDQEIKDICEKGYRSKKTENIENTISKRALEYVKDKMKVFNREDSQSEIDIEMEKIRKEILEERAFIIHKKEEEIAALLNKIQILKAAEHVELKDHHDKLIQLQMIALDSIDDGKNVEGIMRKHNQEKEKLNDAIYMIKKLQEEKFKKRRENSGQKSLIPNDSNKENKIEDQEKLQRREQNTENEILRNNLKSEIEQNQFQNDFFKGLVTAGNFPRSEILELLRNKFPLKTNQEIETIAEEIYPKSQINTKNLQPQKSLIESLKKIKENEIPKDISRPGSAFSTKSNQSKMLRNDHSQRPEPLTSVKEDMLPRKKKKKKNRVQDFDEEINDEAF